VRATVFRERFGGLRERLQKEFGLVELKDVWVAMGG